jgi:Omp85 superfamily domain/Calcineurin-like phosphoesterase
MKNIIGLFGLMLLCGNLAFSQDDTISQRIVLIGDAGQLNAQGWHPVVNAVKRLIPLDKKTTIVYLGDNLYRNGLPDPETLGYDKYKAVLDSQLLIADGKETEVLMMPGNHDWQNGKQGGYDAIVRQQLYADFIIGKKNVKFFPKDGCPGPKEVSLGKDVTMIIFDSQWWLHPHDKPEIESDCDCKTKDELVTQISDIAARNAGKLILLACHHPFKTNGIHGGFFTLKQHLFPLTDINKTLYIPMPVIGSIYPIARSVFGSVQDVKYPAYQEMIKQVSDAVKLSAPNTIFVSGHDHNLQHIFEDGYNYIVSGGGCKTNRTSKHSNSRFNSPSEGFAVLEVSKNKNVNLTFYEVDDTAINKAYNTSLLNFNKISSTIIDTASTITIEDPFIKYKDTITVPASDAFKNVHGLKKLFMGENYRPEWSVPVNMKVFNLKKEKGGFVITGLGGGKQTKSLRLEDKSGKKWVLRSLNKNPHKAIPENFKGTIAEELAMEMNSASHPYAALAIPGMTSVLGITAAKPELFFVPDDPAFALYRPLFANNVCILEERDVVADGTETKTSAKLFNKMLEDNDHQPIQPLVLKARLLDIMSGDFDRHLDQWRWGGIDTGRGRLYYPIPRDRDQAFFYSNGLLTKIASGRFLPFLKGFRNDIPKVNWLGYSARDFDRIFMTNLDGAEWKKAIAEVQQQLSDSVIRSSVKNMPPEAFAINGEKIISKLISRRNLLTTEAMKYYRFISKKVNVIGSNEKEYFKVSNHPDGLQVTVYSRRKGLDTSFIMYNRVFKNGETGTIRLYGLNNEDVFDVDSTVSTRIKLRIIGGKGNDTFNIKGRAEALLYDLKSEGNYITSGSHAKIRFSAEQPVNERSLFGFKYNTTGLPLLNFGYNKDDGFLAGAGISHRTYGFRNLPYASDQKLTVLYSGDRKAVQLKYIGEFNHVTRSVDLLVKAGYSSAALTNYFGLGNNILIRKDINETYYQSRHKILQAEIMLRKRISDIFHIQYGPYFMQYQNRYADNINTIFGKQGASGFDSARIYSNKAYAGFKGSFKIDNRNHEFYPTRGMYWYNELTAGKGLSKVSNNFVSFKTDMAVYASWKENAGLVTVLKFGGGRIYSKNYEFFQAMTIGAGNDLAGFRKNRFAGHSSLYAGIELRLKLFDINSYILPGTVGITGFYDAGRVWHRGEHSTQWHNAFGGGVFYMPFKLFLISGTVGFTENERNFNITLGTKFNLTY